MVNGYSAIALTKLDILDDLDEIQVGINYKKYEKPMEHFPSCEQVSDGPSAKSRWIRHKNFVCFHEKKFFSFIFPY